MACRGKRHERSKIAADLAARGPVPYEHRLQRYQVNVANTAAAILLKRPVKSDAAGGGGLKGQTLQA